MLEELSNSALSVWIRESTDIYAYTLILSVHAVGLAIVVGVNAAIALRLLGCFRGIPLAAVRDFYSLVVFGFCLNAASGILLFISEPVKMVGMPAFWGKMFCIACGMTVVWLLQKWYFSNQSTVDADRITPTARRLAVASLTFWSLALMVGRLTGYPDMVKSYFGF
jgi:hypothetical protein